MDTTLLATATAFGLAASVGLNTTLPLLIVALLSRAGLVDLAQPYDALGSPLVIGGLLLFTVFEFAGDKIPAFDSALQAVQTPVSAAAGAIMFASQSSVISDVSPGLAILVGLVTATGVHGARTAVRPVVTGSTGGIGNPVVSLLEDAGAVALALAAVLLPLIGLLLLLGLVALLVYAALFAVRQGRAVLRWGRRRPDLT